MENIRHEAYITLFNALGPMHYATTEAMYQYALALEELDRYKEAENFYKEAYENFTTLHAEVADIVNAGSRYCFCLTENHKCDIAIPLLKSLDEMAVMNELDRLDLLDMYAFCLHECGNYKEEQRALQQFIENADSPEDAISGYFRTYLSFIADDNLAKARTTINKLIKATDKNEVPEIYIFLLHARIRTYREEEAEKKEKDINRLQTFLKQHKIEDFPSDMMDMMLE